jgi:hypothetical protein
MKTYSGYDLLLGGLFMALALVFPLIFHTLGLGSSFLPMFYPVIAAGFLVSLPVALVVGIFSPLVSALFTGMPPFFPPIALMMMIEGLVLTALPVLFYQRLKKSAWFTTVVTMAADRLVVVLLVLLFSLLLELPERVLTVAVLVNGIPGTILILILIPPLVKQMEAKTRLIRRWE